LRARRSVAGGFWRRQARSAERTSKPHDWHTPRSRFFTSLRTYAGLLRIRHSCTQASLQNVRRGFATTARHQRQIGSPAPFRSGLPQLSAVTDRRRSRLTQQVSDRARRN
jgi:hypothetical protein